MEAKPSRSDEAMEIIAAIAADPTRSILDKLESIHGWSLVGLRPDQRFLDVEKKPWGTFSRHLSTPELEIGQADAKAFGYSSLHCHENKDNTFILVSGCVRIVSCTTADQKWPTVTWLAPGGVFHIQARIFHRFAATKDSRIIEVYTVPHGSMDGTVVDPNDIVRRDVNGMATSIDGVPYP